MEITKINLVNFRNYNKLDISLNKTMNLFIGNNAQGKTNFLESILVLALTKSSRNTFEEQIIQFGKVKNDKLLNELLVIFENNTKKLFVNKSQIKRLSDYISNLYVISFFPDDLEIIKSSPSVRRGVLNIQLSQLSKKYLNTYNEYNKIL